MQALERQCRDSLETLEIRRPTTGHTLEGSCCGRNKLNLFFIACREPGERPTHDVPGRSERIADAMRKRWAAVKKGTAPKVVAPTPKKGKRRLTAEGRRRIIEATKKLWAAVRAAAAKRGK